MKRYLSLWFPDWPLTRLKRSRGTRPSDSPLRESEPFVLLEKGQQGLLVVVANAAAAKLGIGAGLRFTDAKARCPHLQSEDIDRGADAQALKALGNWMMRMAPLVSLDGDDGLIIETTGCAHLYGGEADMLAEISARLDHNGLPHRCGLAGTPGAASALSRSAAGTILGNGSEKSGLADLPVSALRLSREAETLLRRFGLNRIGQLYTIDRTELARRFHSRTMANAVLHRLDQALGRQREPLTYLQFSRPYAACINCPEPIFTRESIETGLQRMMAELCEDLGSLGQGARGFQLSAFRADGIVSHAEITLAHPARTPAHILRLFREKIDQIDPGYGIDLLLLEARRVGPMATSAVALSGDLAASDTDITALSALADRIVAKLGSSSVLIAEFAESHLPERAERRRRFDGKLPLQVRHLSSTGPRPIRMLNPAERVEVLAEVPDGPPQRFVWRRVVRRVVRADGPERLSPEWWRHIAPPPAAANLKGADRKWLSPKLDPRADARLIEKIRSELESQDEGEVLRSLPRARDYYRVEDADGRRYWLFRKGLYGDGRGDHPEWYVHGLFA